jgi:tetratricopeptide (TPR) repeat protein
MNEPQAGEDKQRTRRQLVEQAVLLAMQNKWEQAAAVNSRIVDSYVPDTETWNRLGKAYGQLNRIRDARQAYNEALRLDPTNSIAQRNLQRLAVLKDAEDTGEVENNEGRAARIDPRFFIEETGKTTSRTIFSDAPREVLARVAAGEGVELRRNDDVLVVLTAGNERLGALDSKLSRRLMDLMDGGNQYRAALIGIEGRQVRLLIRETYQAPGMLGRVSFPAEGTGTATVRPLRDLSVVDEIEDDDLDLDGEPDVEEPIDEPDFADEPEV